MPIIIELAKKAILAGFLTLPPEHSRPVHHDPVSILRGRISYFATVAASRDFIMGYLRLAINEDLITMKEYMGLCDFANIKFNYKGPSTGANHESDPGP